MDGVTTTMKSCCSTGQEKFPTNDTELSPCCTGIQMEHSTSNDFQSSPHSCCSACSCINGKTCRCNSRNDCAEKSYEGEKMCTDDASKCNTTCISNKRCHCCNNCTSNTACVCGGNCKCCANDSTFDLLKKGDEEIKLSNEYRDVVLVLGNTGAGKSTFTQWIAGDNSKLIAKEVAEGSGQFIIEDDNRIGISTITSKTIFPELVIDTKTNTAFYDCPGFSDTRSVTNDIATTYFIKKVIDHAQSVKMIFTINHSSLQKGLDRHDFMKLLRHATDLVKDIDKFKNSIAIVATKVSNQYVKQGKSFILVEDYKVIRAIADFLQEVREDLKGRIGISDILSKERKFYDGAIKLIDVLLAKERGFYTKIGIFRRPDEPGPLSNIALLQVGKKDIENILYEKLNFTGKENGDFGYTISDKSKSEINDLVEKINKNILSDIFNIAQKVEEYYYNLVEQMRDKIKSFITGCTAIVAEQLEAETFSSKLSNGYNITLNLIEELTNLTNPEELAGKINSSIIILDINICDDNILNIAEQGRYLKFLQAVTDRNLNTKPWIEIFKDKLPYFSETIKNIQDEIDDTAAKINNYLNDTIKRIHEHYDKKMKLSEIEKLPDELKNEKSVMYNLAKRIENAITSDELLKTVKIIHDRASSLGISIAENYFPIIVNRQKYLNFLQAINDKYLNTGTLTWICPFKDAAKYLNESVKWYIFLNSIFSKLSQYEIQENKSKYNVADIEDWGESGKPQGIEIHKNNLGKFLNKISEYNIAEFDNIKNIEITDLQLKELNHVLNLTLKQQITSFCPEPDRLVIKGDYIKFSDFVKTNGELNNHCNNGDQLNVVNIFALNTVFVDKDLIGIGQKLKVTIVAPKWTIIGNRKITLDGSKGKLHDLPKARDKFDGGRGEHGKPGLPGGSAGTFFGMGEKFINGANVTITANGGVGGLGQNGGNGENGIKGYYAVRDYYDPPCTRDFCYYNKLRTWSSFGHRHIDEFDCNEIHYNQQRIEFPTGIVYTVLSCSYKVLGKSGTWGKSGGRGGRGGKGGYPGDIVLFELKNHSGILRFNNIGADGEDGKGGVGGLGGNYGDDIIISFEGVYNLVGWGTKNIHNDKRAPSGWNGPDGANTDGIKEPETVTVFGKQDKIKIISEYKSYLRNNLNDRFKKYSLTQFINQLDSDSNVKSVYDTLGLVDDLQGLEGQFYKLNKGIDFLPFYKSLLNRICEYAENNKVENSTEHKKVLSYLYTATLGRIYNLENNFESNLIINISGYINSLKESIESLKSLKEEYGRFSSIVNRLNAINKYKENYNDNINKKIEEAKNLIEKQITPELDNISDEIDDKIGSLIKETVALQEQNKAEREELMKKKQELQNMLPLKGLFGIFRIFRQVASFFGPVGAAVGSVVETISGVSESLVLDKQISRQRLTQLPQSVTLIGVQIKAIRDKEIARLNKVLAAISEEASHYPEQLSDLSANINSIKTRLNKSNNFDEIKVLKNEVPKELKRKEKELELQKINIDQKTTNALAVVGRLKQIVECGAEVIDIYIQVKHDAAKRDAVISAIEQKKNEFQKLKQYEETIYNFIAPMLQNVQNDLREAASKLNDKSQVTLDVRKWQIQSTIRDVKLQMIQLTQGFNVKDNLARCIEKLEEAMTTLINVYDRLQDYQMDKRLANYIADISSATASDIKVGYSKLQSALIYLDITISSNLILRRHQTAVDVLKQFVFPFAHIYFNGLMLPTHMQLGGNRNNVELENLVSEAAKQIGHIKSKLDDYKHSVMKHDRCIGTGDFSSNGTSTQPFLVWKNEQHKNMILKLLSGQEVIVKANIMNSVPGKDAVKFNVIEFNFKTQNETMQSKINMILEGFKISITHLGNSYYRYNDKYYLIATNSLDIWYHFEKKGKEPIHRSITYDKIKNGDFMLSPYASWKIKLTNLINKYNFSFKDLETYKDKIDLELGGNGHYIDKTEDNCLSLAVEKHYKAIHIYGQLELKC